MTSLPAVVRSRRLNDLTARTTAGIAIDVGSARTRAWTPEHGVVVDAPTVARGPTRKPVHRGKIIDADAMADVLGNLVCPRARGRGRPTVVATIPVACDEVDRLELLSVLEVLDPETVMTITSVKAAALGARADLARPLLVVDVGAELTEIALLASGALSSARSTALGVSDLGRNLPASQLIQEVAESIIDLMRGDDGPQMVDALDRGILLTGGGALRPEITFKLSTQLGATVQPAPAPHLAALRGAGAVLQSARRHPGAV
ncbi:rod shape-determining protein [Kribbella sp. NPDC054772]